MILRHMCYGLVWSQQVGGSHLTSHDPFLSNLSLPYLGLFDLVLYDPFSSDLTLPDLILSDTMCFDVIVYWPY